ncbi:MAG: four helix bundle protein [Gemmatimonas sp.]
MHNHERIDAWERASDLSVEVCLAIARTRIRRHRAVISQFERAVISIGANIAEGSGQSTDPQFAKFLDIAVASAHEAQSHLRLITKLGVLRGENLAGWRAELLAIRRMTYGLIRRFRG